MQRRMVCRGQKETSSCIIIIMNAEHDKNTRASPHTSLPSVCIPPGSSREMPDGGFDELLC